MSKPEQSETSDGSNNVTELIREPCYQEDYPADELAKLSRQFGSQPNSASTLPALRENPVQREVTPVETAKLPIIDKSFHAATSEVAAWLQKELDAKHSKAKAQLDGVVRRIEAQEKRCLPPKLDDEFQHVRFQRQKILITNGPALADTLREERSRLADLKHFKSQNKLTRDAHYLSSQILAIGILVILILVEACINGVLFAESSEHGLFGGWLEALVLAITNVGIAFLLGRLILPHLNVRSLLPRVIAAFAAIIGIVALIAVNLFGAHYRDYKAEVARTELAGLKPKTTTSQTLSPAHPSYTKEAKKTGAAAPEKTKPPASSTVVPLAKEAPEREAIRKVFAAPFDIQSFTSFFLLIIGLCAAIIAAWDGYRLDDPYPGYGARHRSYVQSRAKTGDALKRIVSQSNSIVTGSFEPITRKIENFGQELAALQALHAAYASDLGTLQTGLESEARKAEAEIAHHYRSNKLHGHSQQDTVGVAALSGLSEERVKIREKHERKLAELRKTVLKEQNTFFDMFETASTDFEKLLAEAAQASLQSAQQPAVGT